MKATFSTIEKLNALMTEAAIKITDLGLNPIKITESEIRFRKSRNKIRYFPFTEKFFINEKKEGKGFDNLVNQLK